MKVCECIEKEELVIEYIYKVFILELELVIVIEYLNIGKKLLELNKIEVVIKCYCNVVKINFNLLVGY